MSHFTRIKTRFVDDQRLIKALREMGFKEIEVHEAAQHLYGFLGDRRPQKAEIIIRRKHLSRSSNDIGFARQDDGTFLAYISGFDRPKYNDAWIGKLTQRYAYLATQETLADQGFTLVEEQKSPDGRIHMILRRTA